MPENKKLKPPSELTPDWMTNLRNFLFGSGTLEKLATPMKTSPVLSKGPPNIMALNTVVDENTRRKRELRVKQEREAAAPAIAASQEALNVLKTKKRMQ